MAPEQTGNQKGTQWPANRSLQAHDDKDEEEKMRAECILVLLAFAAGTAVPVQFAVNAEMRGRAAGRGSRRRSRSSWESGAPRGGADDTRRSAVPLGSGGGAMVGVGRGLSRGVLRNGFDNPATAPGRSNHRWLLHRGSG